MNRKLVITWAPALVTLNKREKGIDYNAGQLKLYIQQKAAQYKTSHNGSYPSTIQHCCPQHGWPDYTVAHLKTRSRYVHPSSPSH